MHGPCPTQHPSDGSFPRPIVISPCRPGFLLPPSSRFPFPYRSRPLSSPSVVRVLLFPATNRSWATSVPIHRTNLPPANLATRRFLCCPGEPLLFSPSRAPRQLRLLSPRAAPASCRLQPSTSVQGYAVLPLAPHRRDPAPPAPVQPRRAAVARSGHSVVATPRRLRSANARCDAAPVTTDARWRRHAPWVSQSACLSTLGMQRRCCKGPVTTSVQACWKLCRRHHQHLPAKVMAGLIML